MKMIFFSFLLAFLPFNKWHRMKPLQHHIHTDLQILTVAAYHWQVFPSK